MEAKQEHVRERRLLSGARCVFEPLQRNGGSNRCTSLQLNSKRWGSRCSQRWANCQEFGNTLVWVMRSWTLLCIIYWVAEHQLDCFWKKTKMLLKNSKTSQIQPSNRRNLTHFDLKVKSKLCFDNIQLILEETQSAWSSGDYKCQVDSCVAVLELICASVQLVCQNLCSWKEKTVFYSY